MSYFKDEIALMNKWLLYFGIVSFIIPIFLFAGVVLNNFILILIYIALEILAFPTMAIFGIVYLALYKFLFQYITDIYSEWIIIIFVAIVGIIAGE